jgi:nucleoside phosphorylase/5'-deoxynucleotidase YfbR-like HD superfamily hydrolase
MNAVGDCKFDYAVIVALDEEASYFVDVIECGEAFDFAGFTGRTITQDNWQARGAGVLISSGDMGKDLAIATAKAAIEKGGVRTIFNVGIAGRVDRDLSIGDVVIPTMIHDVTNGSKLAGEPGGRTHWKLSPEVRAVPGGLATRARIDFAARSASLRLINEKIKSRFPDLSLLPKRGIQVHSRPHACVPAVIAYDDLREDVSQIHRKMATMDMETAGIVLGAIGTDVDVLCIRAISDGADQHKRDLELQFNDENRRFAMEVAVAVLDRTIEMQANLPEVDPDTIPNPKDGLRFVVSSDDDFPEDWLGDYQRHEELFSLLVVDRHDDQLDSPIASFVRQLVSDDRGPALLIGEKGAGKTTFLNFLQHALVAQAVREAQREEGQVDAAYFLRMSSFEEWDPEESGKLDAALSTAKVKEACEKIVKQSRDRKGDVFVIIDGLNQTGQHRINMVAEAIRLLRGIPRIRFALSAERMQDVILLDGTVTLNVRSRAELRPVPIEDASTEALVERFAAVVRSQYSPAVVLADLKDKGVAFVDLFLLGQFFGKFRWLTYDEFQYLSECYHQFCINELSHAGAPAELDSHQLISEIAETAFDILISRKQKFTDVKRRETAQLMSNHASVTNYLVARHVIDTFVTPDASRSRMKARLNYVFPAEINKFTKQIMLSDPHIEEQVIARIKREFNGLGTLARSHCAYLAGRVSDSRAPEMREFLKRVSLKLNPPKPGQRDHRMLRRSVLISRSMLGDVDAERDYAELLLRDAEESSFNRGFHLEYYGDVPFEPDGKMASGDDKDRPCDRTFARLLDRIHMRPEDQPPLIELITLLSLVQFRLFSGTLRNRHRRQALDLLDKPGLRRGINLPPRIRGYIGRIREDLAAERFDLSTVFDDWIALQNTHRTGWLRRRRDADEASRSFWAEKRIESVAEHVFSAIGLATLFLRDKGEEDEPYSKQGIIEMLLYHDLAEGRLGDKLPQHADAEAEQEVLWEYGAFGTYPGLAHMWRIPTAFQEFTAGVTMNARIAQDIDRLQFIVQSRLYRDGISAKERAECEKASGKFTTKTVRGILTSIANLPVTPRFVQPDPQF